MDAPAPLLVMLLPVKLERFTARGLVEELLRVRNVVAVDPPPVSYRLLARLPEALNAWLAYSQAGRMKLPGEPRAVAIFNADQYDLARGLIARHPGAELWYGRVTDDRVPVQELDMMARRRAALTFAGKDADVLYQRLRELGIT